MVLNILPLVMLGFCMLDSNYYSFAESKDINERPTADL